MSSREPPFEEIQETLKRSSAALKAAEVEFVLAGGVACWARGGPSTTHDIDYMVRRRDSEAALEALERAGLHGEHPPEEWLVKAWDGDVLIDVIFAPIGLVVDDELFERSGTLDVLGVSMHVMQIEDVFTAKLLAMHEHYLDLEPLIDIARSVREQIDWPLLRARTEDSPYARAFFTIADGLGLSGETPESERHPGGLVPEGRRAIETNAASSGASPSSS